MKLFFILWDFSIRIWLIGVLVTVHMVLWGRWVILMISKDLFISIYCWIFDLLWHRKRFGVLKLGGVMAYFCMCILMCLCLRYEPWIEGLVWKGCRLVLHLRWGFIMILNWVWFITCSLLIVNRFGSCIHITLWCRGGDPLTLYRFTTVVLPTVVRLWYLSGCKVEIGIIWCPLFLLISEWILKWLFLNSIQWCIFWRGVNYHFINLSFELTKRVRNSYIWVYWLWPDQEKKLKAVISEAESMDKRSGK